MEEKSTSTFKFALMYGLMTAAAVIVLDLIFYVMEVPMETFNIRLLGMVAYIGGMVWGASVYKKEIGNGFMTYGKAFSVSYIIAIITALIVSIYTIVFVEFFDPSIITEILDKTEQTMLDQGNMTDAQIDQALEMTAKFTSPIMMGVMAFITSAVIYAIVALVSSIFVKKEEEI